MKTFRMIGIALVAMMFCFTMSSCDNEENEAVVDPYKDYPQLIVGQWFNITPESSMYINYGADGTVSGVGWDKTLGWLNSYGTYRLEGNKLISSYIQDDGSKLEKSQYIEVTEEQYIVKNVIDNPEFGTRIHFRVRESFDITGKYSYLNSAVRVVPAEGKTALQLPEGVTFNGENSIPVESLHGDRIIDVMKKFFADATFAADGKLNHTMDGEAKTKNYTHNGNSLTFNLYEGSDVYKVNATTFPDEDGDRLFIIIPKQAAWMGGMVDLVEKENEGLKLTEAQIKELETEFMNTFETFTVILSLSKN